MADQELHLTKSHLLRRLLQRRVERLESEKADLRGHIHALEQRLADAGGASSPAAHAAQEALEQTMLTLRRISEKSESEAELTVRLLSHEQAKLGAMVTALRHESNRLTSTLAEALESLNGLEAQARTSSARWLNEAQLRQQALTLEVEQLHEQPAERPLAERRRQLFAVAEEAQREGEQLARQLEEERTQLLALAATMRAESVALQETLQKAIAGANALAEGSQRSATRLIRQSHGLAASPAGPVPQPPRTEPRPAQHPQRNEEAVLKVARQALLAEAQASNGPHPAATPPALRPPYQATRLRYDAPYLTPTLPDPRRRWATVAALAFVTALVALILAGVLV